MTDETDRIPWDVYARLEMPMDMLSLALHLWEGRDESKPQRHVRRAANEAAAAIDEMIRELQLMRGRLMTEIRAYDAAHAAPGGRGDARWLG